MFELTREPGGQWKENVLYDFCAVGICEDGGSSYAGLVFDKAGNLYGTTFSGGAYKINGVVFALTSGAAGGMWNEVPLYSFEGAPDGGNPVAGLILDAAGNLYGAAGGGVYGNGVVFEVIP